MASLPLRNWELALSVPLYLEYLDVLSRPGLVPEAFTANDIADLCRYLASIAHKQDIHFLWRPFLPDPKDDSVLELAVAAGAKYVVTHNARHFQGVERLGVSVLAPRDFLRLVRGQP